MDEQREYWDKLYSAISDNKPIYDNWLDKHSHILMQSKDIPIIDLGCGSGNNTCYLTEKQYKVVSCDYSKEALNLLGNVLNSVNSMCFDMREGLPFDDKSAQIVISDLSLHYFTWAKTLEILEEIKRVLTDDGVLLCRVNSINDKNHGTLKGKKIEDYYYDVEGKLKRFFDESKLRELFEGWHIVHIDEVEIHRYGVPKIAWEIVISKK